MSPPVGPTGITEACDGTSSRYRVGASLAGFDTTIVFSDGSRASLRQAGVAASLDRRVGDRVTFQIALGSAVAGRIGDDTLRAGPLGSLAFSLRAVDDSPRSPFVIMTASLAQSYVKTSLSSLAATDGRIGVAIGKTIAPLAPYVVARAFGGPVYYNDLVGSDRYHYQVGAGLLVFSGGFSGALEVAFLGERRVTASLGWAL
jgi:hypothetical protein